jgi:hypothetical protein
VQCFCALHLHGLLPLRYPAHSSLAAQCLFLVSVFMMVSTEQVKQMAARARGLGTDACPAVQRGNAHFTCVAFVMGFQLLGDSEGRVRIYEQNHLQSTVHVLVPPEGSEWRSTGPDALQNVNTECGSKALVGIASFGRGFVVVTHGGFLAVCSALPGRCTAYLPPQSGLFDSLPLKIWLGSFLCCTNQTYPWRTARLSNSMHVSGSCIF